MPRIVSDVVDVYPFRRVNARIQFLVLRRKDDDPAGGRWQAVHGRIHNGEHTVSAVQRELTSATGLTASKLYSADFVAQFYDNGSDTVVLAPSFAAQIEARSRPDVAPEFIDYAWCDLEETTARLPMTAQRWAVRHIYETIALGGEESDLYEVS